MVTGADGAYAFRTIKPTEYPGRTPHIHVKAFVGNRELTTQFYLDNHPLNARDRIYGRLSETDRELVTMRFVEGPDGPQADVNILI